jgi:hypothetical protein
MSIEANKTSLAFLMVNSIKNFEKKYNSGNFEKRPTVRTGTLPPGHVM